MTNAHGWEEDLYWSDPLVQAAFRREPLEGLEKVHAKHGHLREAKRQAEAEERARADLDE